MELDDGSGVRIPKNFYSQKAIKACLFVHTENSNRIGKLSH